MKTKTLIAGAMLVGVGLWLAQPGFAAETATAPATQQASTTVAYGFKYLLEGVLILMSVGGIALIIDAMIQIRESRIMPADVTEKIKTFIGARQYKELMEYTTAEQSFVAVALNAGLRRARQGFGGMRDGVETAAAEQSANWFRRIEFLNIIGNLGPLVGLMGTVLGMIIAFNELGDPNDASHMAQGAAKVARLAPGISTALWHTFGGLFVAIPCLMIFGYYRTRVDRITMKASLLADELIESMRPVEAGDEPPPRRPMSATMETETTTA